ncbi:MAG: hypothetical protein DRJ41_00585 [Thermoprotei archaeon]|nr:MAG: hypothetical protein DRJ41_00585 [Thermoprotei archaeon]
MSYMDIGSRKFIAELSSMVNKKIIVRTTSNRSYTGTLLGYSTPSYSVVLSDVKDEEGHEYPRAVIYGHAITELFLAEEPLDMAELARRLEEIFPRMIKYYPEAKLITIMDRVKITESGIEGSGPIAERVRSIYERFLAEWKERKKE